MNNYKIEENINLKKYNTYGIGGVAKYLIRPYNIAGLNETLEFLRKSNIPFYVIGSGSNIILPDNDFNGAIIKLDLMNDLVIDTDTVYASAGLNLNKLLNKLLDNGYINMINLIGIPGSLGGAIVGNAGAFNTSIFDYLLSVKIMNLDGSIEEIKKDDIKYEYRNTEFKNNNKKIIIGATLSISKGNVEDAIKIIKEHNEKRINTQPLEHRNAGSVFKNGETYSAGHLIDSLGLKGYNINDAFISNKHANFIVNMGNATSKDIKDLIKFIQNKIKVEKNIDLKLEQVIVEWGKNYAKDEGKKEIKCS